MESNSKTKRRREATPAQLEMALKSELAITAWPAAARHEALDELSAARRSLERSACSSTWSYDGWNSGQAFPPPADTTPMVRCDCDRCRRQGRLWPCIYAGPSVEGGARAQHTRVGPAASAAGEVTGAAGPPACGAASAHPPKLSYECYIESLGDSEAAQIPSSPSGLALRAIREGRIRLRRQRTRLGGRRAT